jgi:hypothetical protein
VGAAPQACLCLTLSGRPSPRLCSPHLLHFLQARRLLDTLNGALLAGPVRALEAADACETAERLLHSVSLMAAEHIAPARQLQASFAAELRSQQGPLVAVLLGWLAQAVEWQEVPVKHPTNATAFVHPRSPRLAHLPDAQNAALTPVDDSNGPLPLRAAGLPAATAAHTSAAPASLRFAAGSLRIRAEGPFACARLGEVLAALERLGAGEPAARALCGPLHPIPFR